jgi:hypothetical protein
MQIHPESESSHDVEWENANKFAKLVDVDIAPEELRNMNADQVMAMATKAFERLKGKSDVEAADEADMREAA